MKFIVEVHGPKGWEIVSEPDLFPDAIAAFAQRLNDGHSVRLTCEVPDENEARVPQDGGQ